MQIKKLSQNRFEGIKTQGDMFRVKPKKIFVQNPQSQIAFKGLSAKAYGGLTEGLAKGLGKLVNTNFMKGTVKFFNGESQNKVARAIGKFINVKEKWFQHAIALESVYLTGFYMYNTKKSKSIPEDQKRPMMINQALVTTLCTALGYTVDSKISKLFNKAKNTFKILNVTKIAEKMKPAVDAAKTTAKHSEAVEVAVKNTFKLLNTATNGLSKFKSVLVFGFIYRYLAPVCLTPIANRVSEFFEKHFDKKSKAKNTLQLDTKFPMSVKFASYNKVA